MLHSFLVCIFDTLRKLLYMPYRVIACFCLYFFCFFGGRAQDNMTASLGKVSLSFFLDADGVPQYKVDYGDKPVVLASKLGFVLRDEADFDRGFVVRGVEQKAVDGSWKPVWGE